MAEEFGTILIIYVNVRLILNGMELHVLRLVLMEKFSIMVCAFAHKVNLKKTENALTIQSAKMELNGTVSNALVYHAFQVVLIVMDVAVVRRLFMLALLVPIGMVIDVFM